VAELTPLLLKQGCLLYFLCLLTFHSAVYARAFPDDYQLADDHYDNLILLNVYLEGEFLYENLVGYQEENTFLLGLQELTDAMGFVIEVDLEEGTAKGWFLQELNRFELDLQAQQVQLTEKSMTLGPNALVYVDDDIFIDIRLLESWFPVTLSVNRFTQQLSIDSSQDLPSQSRIKRQQWRENLSKRKLKAATEFVPDQYRRVSPPVVRLEAAGATGETSEGTDQNLAFNLNGAFDLFNHSTKVSAFRASKGNDTYLINMERMADREDGELFAGLSDYRFGDISVPTQSLVAAGGRGVGFYFNRGSSRSVDSFNAITLEGFTSPGWEVELYRNGELLDFQTAAFPEGNYKFEDIVTVFGENLFEIKLYGRQGQSEIRQERIYVGVNELAPGEFGYTASRINVDKRIVDEDRDDEDNTVRNTRYVSNVQLRYGLSDNILLGLEYDNVEFNDAEMLEDNIEGEEDFSHYEYAIYKAQMSYLNFALNSQYIDQLNGGYAFDNTFRTELFNQQLTFGHTRYKDFIDSKTFSGNGLEERLFTNLNGGFNLFANRQFNYSVRATRDKQLDGQVRDQVSQRLSSYVGWLRYTNELRYDKTRGSDTKVLNGSFQLAGGQSDLNYSGTINYDLEGDKAFPSLGFSVRGKPSDDYYYSFSVNKELTSSEKLLSFNSQLSWLHKNIDYNISTSLNDNRGWNLGFGLNFSLGYDGNTGYIASASSLLSSAIVRVHAFIDENRNGLFDVENEIPISGLGFHKFDQRTNDQGFLVLYDIPERYDYNLLVDVETIEDPFLRVPQKRFTVYGHGGGYLDINIPIQSFIELEGTISTLKKSGDYKAARGVKLVLLDDLNNEIDVTRSEFDGFFLFENAYPCVCSIQIDEKYLERNKLIDPGLISVTISNADQMHIMDELILKPNDDSMPIKKPIPDGPDQGIPTDTPVNVFAINQSIDIPKDSVDMMAAERSVPAKTAPVLMAKRPQLIVSELVDTNLLSYYEKRLNNLPWYSLIYGNFTNHDGASTAIEDFPVMVKDFSPWIRQYKEIQNELDKSMPINHAVLEKPADAFTIQLMGSHDQNYIREMIGKNNADDQQQLMLPASTINDHQKSAVSNSATDEMAQKKYTIQLMGAHEQRHIETYISGFSQSSNVAIYKERRQQKSWYIAGYGEYDSADEARAAKKQLSSIISQDQAWVRQVSPSSNVYLSVSQIN
jgi:hypothetical protein